MKLSITAFGIARDILGGRKYELEVADQATVKVALDQLKNQFPDFVKLKSILLAVNEDYVAEDFVLSENDDVVLVPPVSGG